MECKPGTILKGISHHYACSCREAKIKALIFAAQRVFSTGQAKKSRFNKKYWLVPEEVMQALMEAFNNIEVS